MTVTLTPHAQQLLEQQLLHGGSPEQVVEQALETLAERQPVSYLPRKTVAEAVEHIRASRKGITLGGINIKDLIHQGHKY
jgi:hypothetical protein